MGKPKQCSKINTPKGNELELTFPVSCSLFPAILATFSKMALVHLWSCYQSWSWFPDMRWEWGAQGFEQNWGFGKWRLEMPDTKNGFGRILLPWNSRTGERLCRGRGRVSGGLGRELVAKGHERSLSVMKMLCILIELVVTQIETLAKTQQLYIWSGYILLCVIYISIKLIF